MKTHFLSLLAIVILASCHHSPNPETKADPVAMSQEELIKRGAYLTTIGACHDCHSPKIMTPQGPEPDPSRLLSGHPQNDPIPAIPNSQDWILFSQNLTAFVGPWGVSFAANLTPDDTGTGNWTFEQFKTALRKGKYKGLQTGRDLLPPMPWQMYQHFTDDDMLAIFTYLRSLPKVNNLVPMPIAPDKINTLASVKTK
ncbi:MAG: diheme cytochrome c-553 [Cyclobacteriaceae bacterium]|nr:diheme cytochrome c-553 [Cyclobacteriaceae bacterium]